MSKKVAKEKVKEEAKEEAKEEVKEEAKEEEPKETPKPKTEYREQSHIIYIGKKPTISYVLVAVTILNKRDKCAIQARGRQISKAVDVAEIARRKFLQDSVIIDKVVIGSEELPSDIEGYGPKTVSTIEIVLLKG
jgi:DNA-binding protein